ncbi:DUF1641 domain-containing protein [Maioricimonas sp. JC845]|uniref:DUF1641 domain-containing protein n=1 Tax=Maioricimonas sp. JC845 TaxID=3232138 RepID=UPI00345965F0
MTTAQANGSNAVAQRLADPQVQESLSRLLDRADQLEQTLARVNDMVESVPAFTATAVDVVDDVAGRCASSGIDVDERMRLTVRLIERLTAPEVAGPLERLLSRLEQFEQASRLAEDLPGLLAMAVDIFDEWVCRAADDGIDVEQAVVNGLRAALWMGQHLDQEMLEHLTVFLKSDVLSEGAVEIVGDAGKALTRCHDECCREGEPQELGLLGLMRAMRDPDVRRALGFGVHFARLFGRVHREKS